jgi:hypothetical protein
MDGGQMAYGKNDASLFQIRGATFSQRSVLATRS